MELTSDDVTVWCLLLAMTAACVALGVYSYRCWRAVRRTKEVLDRVYGLKSKR